MNLRLLASSAALFALVWSPSPSPAVDLVGQSRTYVQSREAIDTSRLVPFFEYLDFRVGDIGSSNVSFNFGGWLRYDLKDDSTPNKDKNSDLQYAYLSVRGDRADSALNLGRIRVHEGASSSLVDGALAKTALLGGFGIAAYGGSPAETDFDGRSGDSVYGGRISHSVENLYRVGVSYMKERNNSTDFREEEGIDLWLRPVNKVDLVGDSSYNALNHAWAKHAYYLTLGQFGPLALRTEYTQVSYQDYFTSPTTSAFKFDPTIIDPNEKLTSAGEEASLQFGNFTATADYKKFKYEIAGDATYYGGKLAYSSSLKGGLGAAFHRMYGERDALRYAEYRAYGFTSFGSLSLTADYLLVKYDVEINGVTNATAAVFAAGYALTPKAKLGADLEYDKNPYFNRDVRGMVKFAYAFDLMPAAPGRK